MIVVGISGGPNQLYSTTFPENVPLAHDAAAALVRDGIVVAAAEEERFVRVKHTIKCPAHAIRHCLETAAVEARDVDAWAYYLGPEFLQGLLDLLSLEDPSFTGWVRSQELLGRAIAESTGERVDPAAIRFVPHHVAHAFSAFELSGFQSALVVSYDGGGDDGHGKVFDVRDGAYHLLRNLDASESLGQLYLACTKILGYRLFDEYKVMGLAAHGDADRYLPTLRKSYAIGEGGCFRISNERLAQIAREIGPRRQHEPFSQAHKDFAAAAQAALEEIARHLIEHWQRQTGQRHLCLAGGVALNCTFNGKLARAALFDDIFVQPAAHDAGAALGAALSVHRELAPAVPIAAMGHVYLGTDCGSDAGICRALTAWRDLVAFERHDDICATAAQLLAEGAVIGWVQGRAEFGPRALGNRSILADPRPAANRERLNAIVKKRESFRPFGPSVLCEQAGRYFELGGVSPEHLQFMTFAMDVKPDEASHLAAVTHVDGTARVHVVSKETNPRYWQLIDEFRRRTGVAVLLNTSFNNDAEPIVDSVDDAVTCFATTGLDFLVIGSFLVSRRDARLPASLVPELPWYASLHEELRFVQAAPDMAWTLRGETAGRDVTRALSRRTYECLRGCDGTKSVGELDGGDDAALIDELFDLWCIRLLRMRPSTAHRA